MLNDVGYMDDTKPTETIAEKTDKIPSEEFVEVIKEMDLEEVKDILGLTIKHDDTNKIITFLIMLATYTEDTQNNISYRSISSTGKSYIPIELSQLFPKEDISKIAYASPTSFYHDRSEWDEEEQVLKMNLERKILIFIDQPHDDLLKKLRPLLSHDEKELDVKITDRKEKYGIRTKTVRIRGYPTVIFCSGSLKMNEQEATRSFLLSPETTQEKLRESIELKIKKESNTGEYFEWIASDKRRYYLKERIEQIKKENIKYIVIDSEKIKKLFFENHSKLKPRHQRDISRLIAIIKSLALFNLWYRKREQGNLYASDKDIADGFNIWKEIAVSQDLGIPPYIFKLYEEVIKPLFSIEGLGVKRKDIVTKHYEVYGRPLAEWLLRQEILPSLESVGLIYQEPNPDNRREFLVYSSVEPQGYSLYSTNVEQDNDNLNRYSELRSGEDIVSGDVVSKNKE